MTIKMLDAHLYSTGLDKVRGDRIKYSANRLFEVAEKSSRLEWNNGNRTTC